MIINGKGKGRGEAWCDIWVTNFGISIQDINVSRIAFAYRQARRRGLVYGLLSREAKARNHRDIHTNEVFPMNIVYAFQLTRSLYTQVKQSKKSFAEILNNWDEADYRMLCEYISSCRKVVPKYIGALADVLGESKQSVIKQIIEAKGATSQDYEATSSDKEPKYVTYLPEDSTDTTLFIQQYCAEKKRFM